MKKALSFMFISITLFLGALYAKELNVQVSSTKIAPGQSLKVKITAEGDDVRFPDIQKVGGYQVENLRRMNKIVSRFINGKFSSKTEKILRFEIYPKKSVTIPPFTVIINGKKYQSSPIKVEVSRSAANATAGGFAIRMSLDKKSVSMGEPLILTVDAIEPINGSVNRMEYTAPAFKDFFVKLLGGERQIRKAKSIIHRLEYLLIPKKLGKVYIEPASLRVGIQDMNAPSDPFGIFGSALKWISLRSDSPEVLVKALPKKVDLVGHYQVSAKVSKRKVKANEPVNYTLSIVGEGSLDDFEDPKFDIPGVTVYSDDAVVKSAIKKGHIYSSWSKKYVFIADRDFTIPSLELNEFDYTEGSLKKLKTPSFSIKVKGGSSSSKSVSKRAVPATKPQSAPTTAKASIASAQQKISKNDNLFDDSAYYARKAYEEKEAAFKWYLLGAFVAGMVSMFLLLKLGRFKKRKHRVNLLGTPRHYSEEEALKILYPYIQENKEVEDIVRKILARRQGVKADLDRRRLDRLAAHFEKRREAEA